MTTPRQPKHSSRDDTKPALQKQFPSDPNRASELGMTYGEAAPELRGQRAEPKASVTTVVPEAHRAQESQPAAHLKHPASGPTPKQAGKHTKEKTAEKELEQVQEKTGRLGRYG